MVIIIPLNTVTIQMSSAASIFSVHTNGTADMSGVTNTFSVHSVLWYLSVS